MALTDDLQGWWNFEETSGTRYDETANNNDLTDNNTVGYGTGKIGNAADFENTSSGDNDETLSIVRASQTGLVITGDLSISVWVKPESFPTISPFVCNWGSFAASSAADSLLRKK
jgi:hypothetical protein